MPGVDSVDDSGVGQRRRSGEIETYGISLNGYTRGHENRERPLVLPNLKVIVF